MIYIQHNIDFNTYIFRRIYANICSNLGFRIEYCDEINRTKSIELTRKWQSWRRKGNKSFIYIRNQGANIEPNNHIKMFSNENWHRQHIDANCLVSSSIALKISTQNTFECCIFDESSLFASGFLSKFQEIIT